MSQCWLIYRTGSKVVFTQPMTHRFDEFCKFGCKIQYPKKRSMKQERSKTVARKTHRSSKSSCRNNWWCNSKRIFLPIFIFQSWNPNTSMMIDATFTLTDVFPRTSAMAEWFGRRRRKPTIAMPRWRISNILSTFLSDKIYPRMKRMADHLPDRKSSLGRVYWDV